MISLQPWQFVQLAAVIGGAFAVWKIKNKYFRIAAALIIFMVFVANPIRFKQENISSLEQGGPEFRIETRWTDESDTFSQKQETEMSKLKKDSKNAMD